MSFCFELEENEKQEITSLRLKPNWLTAGPVATCFYVSTWCIVDTCILVYFVRICQYM